MDLNPNLTKPIYIQVADLIENQILEGSIHEEEQIPSTNEIAKFYKINPATVRKGFNLLVDEDIIYKKRGLGMFVKGGAVKYIREKRKKDFIREYVEKMILESRKLGITKEELIKMVQDYQKGGGINE